MNSKFAKWSLVQLLTLVILLAATWAIAAPGDALLHNSSTLKSKYGKWGVAGGKYGQFTCTTCHNKTTSNVKRVNVTLTAPLGSWSSSKAPTVNVVFNNMTAFGTDAGTHTTSTAICQVCHSKTAYHRYNKPVTQADSNHQNANQADCTQCHSHSKAFAPACNSCHGYPPKLATTGIDGMATPATNALGGVAPGAHLAHDSLAMVCTTCHNGYISFTHMTSKKIEIGFAINNTNYPGFGTTAVNSGSFDGASPLNAPYTWKGNGGSTVTTGGTQNCTVYCHGSTLAGVGPRAWNSGSAGKACGTCHGASNTTPPTTNAHNRHAKAGAPNLSLNCAVCHGAHPDNTHVNGNVKWDLGTISNGLAGTPQYKNFGGVYATSGATGGLAPSTSFGQCNNVYCHSNVQGANGIGAPTTFDQPVWSASSVNCDSCHWGQGGAFKLISTGSHRAHVSRGYTFTCNNCHNGAGSTTALHADGKIQVRMKFNGYTGVYSLNGKSAGVGGYGTCTASCHKSGTPVWGSTLAANCLGCHGDKTSATLSGAHNKHTNDATFGGAFNCIDCHATVVSNNVTISNKALHANNLINYSGALSGKFTGVSPVTCSTQYCHSNGKGTAAAPPAWTSSFTAGTTCYKCHGTSGTTGAPDNSTPNSHPKHAPLATDCWKCHFKTASKTAGQLVVGTVDHLDKNIDARLAAPFVGLTNFSGVYSAGKTCTATYCHGGTNPNPTPAWGTAGSTNCNSCHATKPSGLSATHAFHVMSTSGNYNYTNNAAQTSIAANYNYTCASCHGNTTANHLNGPVVNGSDANIQFLYSSAGRGSAATTAYTRTANVGADARGFKYAAGGAANCNATYCHSNGRGGNGNLGSITWSSSQTANCDSCHGNATTSLTLSPLHYKHVNNATLGGNFGCVDCHATTVSSNTTVNNKVKHVNKFVDYSGTMAGKTKNCSNFYCHSNGKGGYANPSTWALATPIGCDGCHGAGNGTGAPAVGVPNNSHPKHAPAATDCWKCHQKTASKTAGQLATGTVDHLDRNIDARLSVVKPGFTSFSGSYNNTTRTCSTTYCHGGSVTTPAWGTAGSTNCNTCHASKPNGLSAGHAFHIMSTSLNYSYSQAAAALSTAANYDFACSSCHGNSNSLHADGPVALGSDATIQFMYTSAGRGANATAAYIRYSTTSADSRGFNYKPGAAGACNNTYCHSNGKAIPGNGASATLSWVSSTTGTCTACHGNEANAATLSGAHNNHINKASTGGKFLCKDCHAKTITNVDNRTLADKSKHVNKMIDYSGLSAGKNRNCSNIYCHSNGKGTFATIPAWTSATVLGCNGCHGTSNLFGRPDNSTPNSHTIHASSGSDCYKCHRLTASPAAGQLVSGTIDHLDGNIDARFSKMALTNYSGVYNANKTCSATYCHGGSVTTPAWGTAGPLACNTCHAANNMLPGAHSIHVNATVPSAGGYTLAAANTSSGTVTNFTCASCHGNTAANHANGPVVLNSDATIFFGFSSAGKNPAYTRTGTVGTDSQGFKWMYGAAGACNATYCHSNGQGGAGALGAINWSSTATAACNSCHGNEANAATLSGAHNKHITGTTGGNFKCKDCHAPTITNADNRTLADKSKHVNKMVNYSGTYAGRNKTCATIYCHSNGKGTFTSPIWTGTNAVGCAYCHATSALTSGSHAKHIAKAATCKYCHSGTTTNDTTITGLQHIDGTVNIVPGGTYTTKAVSFTPVGTTCNNISCHDARATGPYTSSATWGVAATCETCHPKAGLSGAHQVHMGSLDLTSASIYYNMTANRSPATDDTVRMHGFGCANCHPMTAANHLNGTVDVDLNRVNVAGVSTLRFLNHSTAAYGMGTTSKCSNMYCHSNASRIEAESNVKSNTSLAWTDKFSNYPGTDRCAYCHGNQPTTGAHSAHAVGNHTTNDGLGSMLDGNIYNGKSGKVSIANKANTAHGNPNNSTTIGCYICHNGTVTSKANDKNTKCVVCHYTGNSYGALLKGSAAIANLSLHVNGRRDIQFIPIKVVSKAQIRPESYKFYSAVWQRTSYKNMSTLSYDTAKTALNTAVMWHYSSAKFSNCTNIACHNGKQVSWNLSNWNDPNKCMDCHNQL